jgi:uncharacterized RDD family membrane protein YckC
MATSIASPVAFDPERYRTFWERFWAGAIDGVVLSVPFGLLHYFLFPLSRGPVATVAWDLIGSIVAGHTAHFCTGVMDFT